MQLYVHLARLCSRQQQPTAVTGGTYPSPYTEGRLPQIIEQAVAAWMHRAVPGIESRSVKRVAKPAKVMRETLVSLLRAPAECGEQ